MHNKSIRSVTKHRPVDILDGKADIQKIANIMNENKIRLIDAANKNRENYMNTKNRRLC